MQGVDLEQRLLGAQWYCPSNGKTTAKDQTNQRMSSDDDLVNPRWLAIDYAYFARVDDRFASRPEDLVGNSLGAGGLLMADTIYYWRGGNNNSWWFNHHAEGSSTHHTDWGGPVMLGDAIKALSGTNQLFGDSAVVWKRGELFTPDLMQGYSMEVGWVSRNAGPAPNQDTNFY